MLSCIASSRTRLQSALGFSRRIHPYKQTKSMSIDLDNRISLLPEEVLLCIFEQLDSSQDIAYFAQTCRLFYMIASQPRSLALWLVARFGARFALYYSILEMPAYCDDHFVRCLINNGAIIPRHLTQALVMSYGKPSSGSLASRPQILPQGIGLLPFLDCIFGDSVQKMPFSGYATIMHASFMTYQDIHLPTKTDDLGCFLKAISSSSHSKDIDDLVQKYAFIPAPVVQHQALNMHPSFLDLLKLATSSPAIFHKIGFVFEFDPAARRQLWEACHLLLFDIAFKANLDDRHLSQLHSLTKVFHPESGRLLIKDIKDKDLFRFTFVKFFTKYPSTYCTRQTMFNILTLFVRYVKPGFSIPEVLKAIAETPSTREDIRATLFDFIKSSP
ncbi:hypothetical protein CLU79DRAFT_743691 [Phycomyces nitens]|nr:hypothetical protein CLU79DRAFT_743691 [Phycomyces nitens]